MTLKCFITANSLTDAQICHILIRLDLKVLVHVCIYREIKITSHVLELGGITINFAFQSIPGLPLTLNLPVPIHTPGWRKALRIKCLAQKHNTVSSARAWTWTARSKDA